jgi:hypothetical protein
MGITVNGRPLEVLAEEGKDMTVDLGEEVLDGVADLVLRLHQEDARSHGAILPRHMMRPYLERRESERAGMRSAVKHVVMALVLMGIIDQPDARG